MDSNLQSLAAWPRPLGEVMALLPDQNTGEGPLEVACVVGGGLAPRAVSPRCFVAPRPTPGTKWAPTAQNLASERPPPSHTLAGVRGPSQVFLQGRSPSLAPAGEPWGAEAARAGVHSLPSLC